MTSIQAPFVEILLFALSVAGFLLVAFFYLTPQLRVNKQEPDCVLRLFVSAVSVLVVVGWFATTLALIGAYALRWVALLLLALDGVLLGVVFLRRQAPRLRCAWGGWSEIGLLGLMLIGAALYLRPHEYVLGGSDAGSYINIAAATAHRRLFAKGRMEPVPGGAQRSDAAHSAAANARVICSSSAGTSTTRMRRSPDLSFSRIIPFF